MDFEFTPERVRLSTDRESEIKYIIAQAERALETGGTFRLDVAVRQQTTTVTTTVRVER